MTPPINHSRRRRGKQDRSKFAKLVAAPGTGPITLPANASLYLRSVAGCVAGTTAATFKGRVIKTPLLGVGRVMFLGNLERGIVLTPVLGFHVLLDMGLGKVAKIGQGV